MGRESPLKQEEIYEAIVRLVAGGTYLTHAALREALGGRGSPILLQRHLKAWYATHGPRFADKVTAAQNSSAPDTSVLKLEIERLTAKSLQHLESQQAERISAIEAHEAVLIARERQLEEREVGQRELIDHLRSEAAQAMTAKDQALVDLATKAQQLAEAVTRADALKAELSVLQELDRDIAGLQEQLATAAELLQREQEHALALATDRDAQRTRSEALTEELTACQNSERRLQSDLANVTLDRTKVLSRLEAALEAAETQRAAFASSKIEHTASLELAQSHVKDLRAALQAASASAEAMREESTRLTSRNEHLQAALSSATAERDVLLERLTVETLRFDLLSDRLGALSASLRARDEQPPRQG